MKWRLAIFLLFMAFLQTQQQSSVFAPFSTSGLSVLVIEETDPRSPRVAMALNAEDWQSVVKSKGGDLRILDQHIDPSSLPSPWRAARERGFKELPWLVISNGRTGFEGPLPLGEGELANLVRKY